MGWLNSSAGSGFFFFSLCSATKAIVTCLGPASDAVPPCGLSWPFKPGPIPHPVPFQATTPRGRKLEDLFTYLQIFQFKKETCQNPAPCFQLDSPLTVGQIASPSEKLICRFWILYLVMRRWRFSFCDTDKQPLPFIVIAERRFPPSLELNGLVPMFRFELVYKEPYRQTCSSLCWTFASSKPLPSANLARNFTLGCWNIPTIFWSIIQKLNRRAFHWNWTYR